MNTFTILRISLFPLAIACSSGALSNDGESGKTRYEDGAQNNARNENTSNVDTNIETQKGSSSFTSKADKQQQVRDVAGNTGNSRSGTHVQIVSFDKDSVILSESAGDRLENLVQMLRKDKPTKVTVKIEESGARVLPEGRAYTEHATANGDNPVSTNNDPTTSERLDQEIKENEKLISRHRAKRVRQFLEDRGVRISDFDIIGSAFKNRALIDNAQSAKKGMQEVLVVISADLNTAD